ncbi:MAG: DUF3990 domain-containing protein [Lachnospiraceae bacterium]|nr:DUF3990 domain-containing protein [Lachnospiraceae bacterium]
MIKVNCEYTIKEDIDFILDSEGINNLELSKRSKVSRTTLDEIAKKRKISDGVCEKIYSFAYENKYRINAVKEEIIKEKYHTVLFHGSKNGLSEITVAGSRDNCDFGNGFYLGETYNQALSFVCENEKSSVYSFIYSLENLKIKNFDCSLEWMLAICYYRGTLGEYKENEMVKKIVSEIEDSDVVIAPIADNKMFYIMAQFTEGEINAEVALHSLSASKLGIQYIFKTDKAINKLIPIEKYYLSIPEREDCKKKLNERSFEIDTKLKLAKREFKTGLYIEEIIK